MDYLLDVNVLVAWGWADHQEHARVADWIAAMKRKRGSKLLTSAIPELGFVRVSVQRTAGRLPVGDAAEVLAGMLKALGKKHGFLPDGVGSSDDWPKWVSGAGRTTDAHLLKLAQESGAELATLDEGIPGAFVIPR